MPTNKNAMTRCMVIDKLLSCQQHPRTLDELTDEVNDELAKSDIEPVTRRCIEKDIQYIEYESPWMAIIKRKSITDEDPETGRLVTRRCLSYEDPSFSIFKSEMTEEEKSLLSAVLGIVGRFEGIPEFDGLDKLIKGLQLEPKGRAIHMDRNPIENSTLFGHIFNAIYKEWTSEISYHTYKSPLDIKKIKVYPYLLKEYNRRWYLICRAISDGKVLTFALDRIDDIKPIPGIKFKPYKGNLNRRFDEIIGMTFLEDNKPENIIFWVSENSKDYVITKPIHKTQIQLNNDSDLREEYPSLTDGAFFSIDCRENYELIRELSAFGSDLLVLSPASIRDKVYARISLMKTAYDKIQIMN